MKNEIEFETEYYINPTTGLFSKFKIKKRDSMYDLIAITNKGCTQYIDSWLRPQDVRNFLHNFFGDQIRKVIEDEIK